MDIILASSSPRRKELMSLVCKEFKAVSSTVDESKITADTPVLLVKALAQAKAEDIAEKISQFRH